MGNFLLLYRVLRHTDKILKLPSGISLLQNENMKNKSEENSAIEIYFQVGQDASQSSTRANTIADLLRKLFMRNILIS